MELTQMTIPWELTERRQWVAWRYEMRDGKRTKIPINPRTGAWASSTDPSTWGDYKTAVAYCKRRGLSGIGYVFTDEDPYVGIDLDNCRNPETGEMAPTAWHIVKELDSYTEITPSGRGLHILLRGKLPPGGRKIGTEWFCGRKGGVEMYDCGRYFTVTGKYLDEALRTIEERGAELERVHRNFFATPVINDRRYSSGTSRKNIVDLTDYQILEKARRAANGRKFDRLWNGHWQDEYPSRSEADLALCALLAFWTGGDRKLVDSLFRRSGLMRSKWDQPHFNDGRSYGEATVERACRGIRSTVHDDGLL